MPVPLWGLNMPNRHPLTNDFRMYYQGTYVTRDTPMGYEVMFVAAVDSAGDDTDPHNVVFRGRTWGPDGQDISLDSRWRGDEVQARIPRFGYYNFGDGPVYVSYASNNRTNRKGLDARIILFNGQSGGLNGRKASVLFNQCEFPGQFGRDLCVSNNRLLWKGQTVGTLRNGDVVLRKNKEHLKELICKLLGKHLEIKQFQIQDE